MSDASNIAAAGKQAEGLRALLSERRCGWAWGAWISSFPFVDFLLRPPRGGLATYTFDEVRVPPPLLQPALLGLLLLGVVPLALAIMRLSIDFRRASLFALVSLPLIVMIFLSIVPTASVTATATAASALFALVLAAAFLSIRGGDELLRGMLESVAVLHAGILVIVIGDANYAWGRLMGRTGPNYWGTVACLAVFASMAIRTRSVQLAVVGISFATMYLCQSRGSMLATAVGCFAMTLMWVRADLLRRLLPLVLSVFVTIVVLVASYSFIVDRLLMLTSKQRGLESGGTGRADAWVETFQLFAKNPWLGVGYRQSDDLLTSASSAHNAYLATLAELGAFGLLAYLLFVVGGCVRAWAAAGREPNGPRLALAGFLLSYVVIGLLERRGLNVGNSHSLMMILGVAWAYRAPVSGPYWPAAARKVNVEAILAAVRGREARRRKAAALNLSSTLSEEPPLRQRKAGQV